MNFTRLKALKIHFKRVIDLKKKKKLYLINLYLWPKLCFNLGQDEIK